ncbi:MAG: hypothetical protein KGJ60_10095 [Verrucomicrobiota bacterium]|nr:hypothetical protein [Verrucomicrobiota bacterium]
MKMNIAKLATLGLLAAAILAVPAASRGAESTNAAATAGQSTRHKRAPGLVPFRGAVAAVDTNAMTLTIGKRTLDITSETRITKNGEPATLSDLAVGDAVGGAYKKTDDGKLQARTIHAGKKKAKADAQN